MWRQNESDAAASRTRESPDVDRTRQSRNTQRGRDVNRGLPSFPRALATPETRWLAMEALAKPDDIAETVLRVLRKPR
jgi:hypothetical protein